MEKTIDWNDAAARDDEAKRLKSEVDKNGGYLRMHKEVIRRRFGIHKLACRNTEDLAATLSKYGMTVYPQLHDEYYDWGKWFNVYDIESDIGKIAKAVWCPDEVSEAALRDAVDLHKRAEAGRARRSVRAPWLSALDVFLQLVIGRLPEDWEVLDDDREVFQLRNDVAKSLGLPDELANDKEIVRVAAAVCACRPPAHSWEGAPRGLGVALADAARKQKEIFDRLLREAAEHLLGRVDIPPGEVDLGRLGLRYRCEAQEGKGHI